MKVDRDEAINQNANILNLKEKKKRKSNPIKMKAHHPTMDPILRHENVWDLHLFFYKLNIGHKLQYLPLQHVFQQCQTSNNSILFYQTRIYFAAKGTRSDYIPGIIFCYPLSCLNTHCFFRETCIYKYNELDVKDFAIYSLLPQS